MNSPAWSLVNDAEATDRAAAAVVDSGLGAFNVAAAPLNEVRTVACFARKSAGDAGGVIGGVIGRTWGDCAEIQQLWVNSAWRGVGIGSALVARFESIAALRGCSLAYLDTFSFQAPDFYRRLGWDLIHTISGFGPGIAKHTMQKRLGSAHSANRLHP
jgi:GNAT superfamily N-acetyltransferase